MWDWGMRGQSDELAIWNSTGTSGSTAAREEESRTQDSQRDAGSGMIW
ncbi:rCG45928, partial [Rattus norvegicus]